MTLQECIGDFLHHLQAERGVRPTTVETYGTRLRSFHAWLEANGHPTPGLDTFCVAVLRRYLYHLHSKKLRPRTIRGFFNAIRSLGAFLLTNEAIPENYALKIGLPKKDATERIPVTDEEAVLLLDACERLRTPRQMALARALIGVFVYCGLRRSEALDLKTADVNLRERTLTVWHGKGDKSRKIPLCDEIFDALNEWIALRGEARHEWLFAYDRNRRLHDLGLRHLFESLKGIAGLRDAHHVLPHGLRHGFASRMFRAGVDIRTLQELLGHSQLQTTTTAIYLHVSEKHLQEVAPMASLKQQSPAIKPAAKADDKIIRLNMQKADHEKRLRRIASR